MCYINGIKVSLATFLQYKKIQKELKAINKILNNRGIQKGFEYSNWPVIKASADGKDWDIVPMEWGFLPSHVQNEESVKRWRFGYKDDRGVFSKPYITLNAIGEEILDKSKMFRPAAKSRRCLILSSGFYEHRHVIVMGKRGKPLKTPEKFPYHITVKGKDIFMMAGIWNPMVDAQTGERRETFAIVTTAANKLMEQVHNSKKRMPVIFTDEQADRWLDNDLTEKEIHELATVQYPSHLMEAYPIQKSFLEEENPNEPFVYPELPELIS